MKALSGPAAAAIAVLLSAQADPARGNGRVVDAEAAQVTHCTFVEDVDGRSVFGERLKEAGIS